MFPRLHRNRRGEKQGVVAHAVAAQRLAQDEPAAEDSVLAGLGLSAGIGTEFVGEARSSSSRRAAVELVFLDQNPPRENADRAFQHAHVLIDNHMRDIGAVEQRFDRGDQDEIVGANEFAQ